MNRLIVTGTITLLLVVGGNGNAAPTIFFGEDLAPAGNPANMVNSNAASASFQSMLSGVSTETFESFASGQTPPIVVNFGPDTATLTGFNSVLGGPGAGRFAISPTHFVETNAGLSLTFSAAQAAFGFFGTDIGDFAGQLRISLNGGPPILVPHTINGPSGTGLFFGIIDVGSPFTTVTFSTTTGSDFFGFDNFTIGRIEQVTGIPEPASMLAWGLLASVACLGSRLRRRCQKVS